MTYLSFNFANWVTVGIMALVFFGLLAFAQKGVVAMQNKK